MCLAIAVVSIALLLLFLGNMFKSNVKSKNPELNYRNIIYKVRFDFGAEDYIYLLPNKTIKTVEIQEMHEVDPDCNCMVATGEFKYIENKIRFSQKSKDKVIKVLNELSKMSGSKDFDADDMELTKYQKRILLGVVSNDEDYVSIDEDIKIKNKQGRMVLDTSSSNKIVKKMANLINEKANADYEKYNRSTMSTLELLYVGPYSISFVYKLYGTNVNEVKGYSFNYNGDIRKFEENGLKDGILGEAMLNFFSSDLYKNNASQLYANWEPVFKNKAFDTGNWCFDENKIKFFIPAKDLGIESDEIITIDVDNGEDY